MSHKFWENFQRLENTLYNISNLVSMVTKYALVLQLIMALHRWQINCSVMSHKLEIWKDFYNLVWRVSKHEIVKNFRKKYFWDNYSQNSCRMWTNYLPMSCYNLPQSASPKLLPLNLGNRIWNILFMKNVYNFTFQHVSNKVVNVLVRHNGAIYLTSVKCHNKLEY